MNFSSGRRGKPSADFLKIAVGFAPTAMILVEAICRGIAPLSAAADRNGNWTGLSEAAPSVQ